MEMRAIQLNGKGVTAQAFVENARDAEAFALRHGRDAEVYIGVAPRIADKKYGPPRALWVDVDFKNTPEKTIRTDLLLTDLTPSVIVRSGGGLHLYWLIDFEVKDPTPYLRWLALEFDGDMACAEPARILRLPGTMNHKYKPMRPVVIEEMNVELVYGESAFERSSLAVSGTGGYSGPTGGPAALDAAKDIVRDYPIAISGQGGDKKTYDLACELVRNYALAEVDALELMLEWNKRCEPPWTVEDIRKKIYSAMRYGKGEVGASDPARDFAGVEAGGGEEDGGEEHSKLQATLKNAVLEIEKFKVLPTYDDFLNRVMIGKREWTDADDLELTIVLQSRNGFSRMSVEMARSAALTVAFRNRGHSFQSWLDSLRWDGISRVDRFFAKYFGADSSEYSSAASKNFWVSICARAYRPGCKVDNMIVLEGPQGIKKSSALHVIGGDWFTEQHESATNSKAFGEVLQGKFLIEISEMDSFSKSEVTSVKASISCGNDRFREAYGRHAKDHPRQCVFVGTTNKNDWNRDETGARRFWPIACKGINLDAIRLDREQLFAEAVVRFKRGESWWEMPEEALVQQTERYVPPAWVEPIQAYLNAEPLEPLLETSVAEILEKALGIPEGQWSKSNEMRVAESLKYIGWMRKTVERNRKTVKRWFRNV